MKRLFTVLLTAFAAVGLSVSVLAKNCCDKAKDAGKECDHPCCVEAAKAGKSCEKCAGKPKTCCEKAKAKGKECEHPCCVEATKAGKVCEKCNPAEKKEEEKKAE